MDTELQNRTAPSGPPDVAASAYAPRSEADRHEDARRRSHVQARCFSHSAMRASDLRKTRHFYEDIIGLPLVRADRLKQSPSQKGGIPFDMIHIFFELGDGSMIAFFEADKNVADPDHVFPRNPLQLHFAVRMESEQAIRDAEARLKAEGYFCMYVPHHDALSLYIDDPDGLQFELIYHWDHFDNSLDPAGARQSLDAWYESGRRWS